MAGSKSALLFLLFVAIYSTVPGHVSGANTCPKYNPNDPNGDINCPQSNPGDPCDYKSNCTVGYIPSSNVVCLSNGSWSAIPECIEAKCPAQNNLNHGFIDCQQSIYQDPCTYKCDTFYGPSKTTITCGPDGQWTPKPTCGGSSITTAALYLTGLTSVLQYLIIKC